MNEIAGKNRIERRKSEFRDRITAAAIALFEENGVAETSIASIIRRADIAHKTFFNHFPTKDHLLEHIASTFSARAYAEFRDGLGRIKEPAARVEYCFLKIATVLESVKPHYRELLNFYLISGAGSSELRATQKAGFAAIIRQIVVDAGEQEQLRPGFSAETYTDLITGLCVSTLLNWSLEDDFPIVEKMRDASRFIAASIFREMPAAG